MTSHRKNDQRIGDAVASTADETRQNCAPSPRLRLGMLCPRCQSAFLDYDGLLQLACPQWGVLEAGAFT
jgi:hypothetical protein